jgi:glutathione S-transferase
MKLWHCKDARSLRPLWALEELNLDYELEVLPFPPRVFKKEFLALNPLGTIPYFVDGEVKMTESSAICLYLVNRYEGNNLSLSVMDAGYGEYLNWLFMSDATLTFPQTIVLRYTQLEPEERRLPQAASDYRKWFLARLRMLDAHLLGNNYLCNDTFTIADIAIGYALFLGENLGIAGDYQPQTQAYLQQLKQRPAFKRARLAGK